VEIFVSPAKGFYLLARLKSLKVFRKRIDSRSLVWKIFQGKDQKAADRIYYDR
jgi:hypothetical protein